MKRSEGKFLVGLVVLVAGAAVLVYGMIAYNNARASLGGALGKLLTGSSTAENQSVIEMIVGGAAAVVGLALMVFRGKRRR